MRYGKYNIVGKTVYLTLYQFLFLFHKREPGFSDNEMCCGTPMIR